jgi:hypothetical protein
MKILFGASAAAIALLVAFAQPSQASLMLQITDGAVTLPTLNDPGNTGQIVFTGPLAGFSFSFDAGLSKPVMGDMTHPVLDLSFNEVATAGGTLTFALTDTGFSNGPGIINFLSAVGGTFHNGGSMTLTTSMDCGNTPFGTGTPLSTQTLSGAAFSGGENALVSACGGPYSLTELATFTLPAGAQVSGDANLAIPEPSTVALLAAGLTGLGFALRRKGQQASTAA